MPPSASVSALRIELKAEITASWVITVTSSSPWRSLSRRTTRLLRALELGVGAYLDQQPEQARAVEHLHRRRDRHDHDVVHVDPELQAARLEDADHAHAPVADPHHLADRVRAGEELLREPCCRARRPARRGPRRSPAAGSARARCPGGAPRAPRACRRRAPPAAAAPRRPPSRCRRPCGASLSTSRTPRATARASSSVRSCGTPPMPGMAPVVSVFPGQHDHQVACRRSRTGRARSAARPRRAPSA